MLGEFVDFRWGLAKKRGVDTPMLTMSQYEISNKKSKNIKRYKAKDSKSVKY